MESLLFLLKGILIGLLFGVPVGAVGTMTVSRTLNHGFGAGIITGLGSSVADCIYAGVGAFGLTLVSDFLLKYETVIHLLGGCLVITMGISVFLESRKAPMKTDRLKESCRCFSPLSLSELRILLQYLLSCSPFPILTCQPE